LSIYDNDELASLGASFSSLATVTAYTSVANNPSLLCATVVGSRVGCGANRLVPRNGVDDDLAITAPSTSEPTNLARHDLPDQGPDPDTDPDPNPDQLPTLTTSPTTAVINPSPGPVHQPGQS